MRHYIFCSIILELEQKVIDIPEEIDNKIAMMKLKSLGIAIDELTEEQKRYINSW